MKSDFTMQEFININRSDIINDTKALKELLEMCMLRKQKSNDPFVLNDLSEITGLTIAELRDIKVNTPNKELASIIKECEVKAERDLVYFAINNKANSTMTMFVLKNQFGYDSEVATKGAISLSDIAQLEANLVAMNGGVKSE